MAQATKGWETINNDTHPGRGWWAQRRVTADNRTLWFDIGSPTMQFCYSDGVYLGSRKNMEDAKALCERGKVEGYVMSDEEMTMSTEEQFKSLKLKGTLKWTLVTKGNWIADTIGEEKQPPRIRELDGKTFAVYRDANYLGCEETLKLAQMRAMINAKSDRNRVMRLWEQSNPGELPPYLQMTDGERAEWWRRNPPKRKEVASVAPRTGGTPGEGRPVKAARPPKAEKPSTLDPASALTVVNTTNPKQPGSAPHARWALLLAGGHATVGAFLEAGGNPETLKNAVAKGYVKLGG